METPSQSSVQLPADLIAKIEAIASSVHRPVVEILRDAVERYVDACRLSAGAGSSSGSSAKPSAREAAARMLARRHAHPLPAGTSIRDLATFGRA